MFDKILNYTLVAVIFLGVGFYAGTYLATEDTINEIDRWHTARLWEDGSWQVEYKDGTTGTGCIATGLCQD